MYLLKKFKCFIFRNEKIIACMLIIRPNLTLDWSKSNFADSPKHDLYVLNVVRNSMCWKLDEKITE